LHTEGVKTSIALIWAKRSDGLVDTRPLALAGSKESFAAPHRTKPMVEWMNG